jgi:DNA-binding beta-propeller fold protein YncE
MVFDFEKKTFGPLKGAQGMGKLVQPLNISVDSEGNKFVTDPIRGQVVMFDRNDFYVMSYGEPGNWKPVDAAPFEDRLYVVDIKNAEIKIFDKKSGDFIKGIGQTGEPAGWLVQPTNIAFDKTGYMYISDAGRFQIVKYDRDGHLSGTVGKLGSNVGHFARPRGIAVDREGRLFAVDAAFDTVQIFREAQLLLFFGKAGKKPGDLFLPAKVAIDYDNVRYFQDYAQPSFQIEYLLLVTSQFGDKMVNVYAFGKEKGRKYPDEEELLRELEKKMKAATPPPADKTEEEKDKDKEQ